MTRTIALAAVALAATSSSAFWSISKTADRTRGGEWAVGCYATVPNGLRLIWDNRVYQTRLAAGQEDPFKPIVQIGTAVSQLESRPIEGTVYGEVCTVEVPAFEVTCEPATVEYPMQLSLTDGDGETRHHDIWVQAVSVGYELDPAILHSVVGAEGLDPNESVEEFTGSGGIEEIVIAGGIHETVIWGDWPATLIAGDSTFVWRRGGTSQTQDYWPVSSSGVLLNTAVLRRQYSSCIQSHVRGGRIMAREPSRQHLIEKVKRHLNERGYPIDR